MIVGKPETLSAYLNLRNQGYSPAKSLQPFAKLLSYNPEESIQTGYDAYREWFQWFPLDAPAKKQ